jgi:hypothetical protein
MATRVHESGVIQQAIARVWEVVRPLDFSFLTSVSKSEVEGNGVSVSKVGGTRRVTYKDGAVQRFRLTELSDANHTLTYELIDSQPEVKYLSAIHSVTLTRISTLNHTLVELVSDFSKDADLNSIQDAKYKKLDFIRQLATAVEPKAVKFFRQVSMRTSKFDKLTGGQVDEAWNAFDKDGNGVLDKSEMKDVIEGLLKRIASEQAAIRGAVANMFQDAKTDEKTEVKAADVSEEIFRDLQKRKEGLVRELSGRLDVNKDGKVDYAEFKLLFANWFESKIQEGIRNAFK